MHAFPVKEGSLDEAHSPPVRKDHDTTRSIIAKLLSSNNGSVLGTVARAREGVRNTSGFTLKRQARGGAHLGLHCRRQVPHLGTSHFTARGVGV